MELSTEDKTRIDKAADEFGFQVPFDGTQNFYEHGKVEGFQAGAEYATTYERQELRNKVIEECIAIICSTAPEYGPIEKLRKVRELLNSLKTK